MKQFLLVDLNSDYSELMDYKGLKDLLIETIQEDLLMNNGEYDIAKNCSDKLIKIAKDYSSEPWIKNELLSYSYKVIDLLDLQRDLEDLKQHFEKDYFTNAFSEVINKINNEVNKE